MLAILISLISSVFPQCSVENDAYCYWPATDDAAPIVLVVDHYAYVIGD